MSQEGPRHRPPTERAPSKEPASFPNERADVPSEPAEANPKPGEATRSSAPSPANRTAEEYRKYREAEREEERRLNRYERTSSIDTTREKDPE